jgi:hypothetical protein
MKPVNETAFADILKLRAQLLASGGYFAKMNTPWHSGWKAIQLIAGYLFTGR